MNQTPKELGDFEIFRELGRGGMGVVYEARQKSLNRSVALKVLSAGLGMTGNAVIRFRREAEAAGKLHHTNIVPVYSTGEDGGTHYYAMEMVKGPSLDQVIRQMRAQQRPNLPPVEGSLDTTDAHSSADDELSPWVEETIGYSAGPAENDSKPSDGDSSVSGDRSSGISSNSNYFDNVARMMAEVADALEHAHEQGVIHRDIKPSNLLLAPDGRLSVNDFGLARILEQPGMTISGEFVGSPLYMSPEQIVAGRMRLDHRTDIYSLGATLYEMLTLQPPFPGQHRDEIIGQIMTKEPRPPRKLNKKIPTDLETICLKSIEKDPDRRYPTARELADDLRRYVNRHAISARRAGPIERVVKWARRRPAVASLACCVLVIALGAAGLWFRAHQLEQSARETQGQQALDAALLEALSGKYNQIDKHLDEAELLGVAPGRIRLLRGWGATEQDDYNEAIRHLEVASQLLPNSLAAKSLLAHSYMNTFEHERAVALYVETLDMPPTTPDDYLYGAFGVGPIRPKLAVEWLEELNEQHNSPAVHYMLGCAYFRQLQDSYDPNEVERVIGLIGAARTTMPDHITAQRRHIMAQMMAADIYKQQEDDGRYQHHLSEAQRSADFMLARYPEEARSHQINAMLAAFVGEWETAASFAEQTIARADNPDELSYIPAILYRSGRLEGALSCYDVAPLKAKFKVTTFQPFLATELEGDFEATSRDLRQVLPQFEKNELVTSRSLAYQLFAFWGHIDEARSQSRALLERIGPNLMEGKYFEIRDRYLRGDAKENELLDAAAMRIHRLEAHYLFGLTRLAEGDRVGAVREFELVELEGNFVFAETIMNRGHMAHIILHKLRQDANWPPWISIVNED